MKNLIVVFISVLSITNCIAQVETQEDLDKYFDDSNYSKRSGLLNINLLSPFVGDVAIAYEQKLTRRITLEGGVGVLLPFYVREYMEWLVTDAYIPTNVKGGFSWRIEPKIYAKKEAPHGFYVSTMYRERHYSLENNPKLIFRDICLNFGSHFIPKKKISIDYYCGFGVRIKNISSSVNQTATFGRITPVIPISVKLGYMLY